ncbi:hypothetical protein HispidOSU_023243, partial [Sigmodon hispidus]
ASEDPEVFTSPNPKKHQLALKLSKQPPTALEPLRTRETNTSVQRNQCTNYV